MRSFDITDVQPHLDDLVDEVAQGEPFVITKAGVPLAKFLPLDETVTRPMKRIGFLAGQIQIPDDSDSMGSADIDQLFN